MKNLYFSFVSVEMKWNANNIVDFLKIYELHPVLWNTKHKDYCNTKLKDELFKQLYEGYRIFILQLFQ